MKNTLFSGLMIGALVALIGAVGLLNTPSANAEPNCDKAGRGINEGGNFKGNFHCEVDEQPVPSCKSPPQPGGPCRFQGPFFD